MKKFKYLFIILIFILPFCDTVNPGLLDVLSEPIILITKNDSITEVKGANGKAHILHTLDKVNYRIAFMKVGDTLEIE